MTRQVELFQGHSTPVDCGLTTVELHGDVWFKRDDTFSVAGVSGGKARTCWTLAQGASGLVTAGSKSSPQVNIVANVAKLLGIPCRVHTPCGAAGPEVVAAIHAGAERVSHAPGYNSVIVARAAADAMARGWTNIPFGMECEAAVSATRQQVANIPTTDARRLIVPVGSGMSLAGVLWGAIDIGLSIPVVGVVVGADPDRRLDRYAPPEWRGLVRLVRSSQKYHSQAPSVNLNGVTLDPIYEAKMIPFVLPGDCVWCVGIRASSNSSTGAK